MYSNNAYRSWYWAGQLSALAASVSVNDSGESRLSLSYPPFLRRGMEPWRRKALIAKLTSLAGCSIQAAREELWPPLAAIHESGDYTDPDDFTISRELRLDGDEHVLLHGLRSNLKSTKAIVERYNTSNREKQLQDAKQEFDEEEQESQPIIDKSQKTLF
jgi:hypothetical protein